MVLALTTRSSSTTCASAALTGTILLLAGHVVLGSPAVYTATITALDVDGGGSGSNVSGTAVVFAGRGVTGSDANNDTDDNLDSSSTHVGYGGFLEGLEPNLDASNCTAVNGACANHAKMVVKLLHLKVRFVCVICAVAFETEKPESLSARIFVAMECVLNLNSLIVELTIYIIC